MEDTMTEPTVLLFDIDGTLLLSGGAGKRAVSHAFGEILDAPGVLDDFDFRGMTDLALFRSGIEAASRDFTPELAQQLVAAYLRHLKPELEGSSRFRVLPGVQRLLRSLQRRPDVAVGLGTGNVAEGAQLKLRRGELHTYFSFGGFGDDAEDRTEMLRIGASRGAAQLGCQLDQCRVVVIGDSPRDVHASLGIGAVCVAVETGGHSAAELMELGAAFGVETLEDAAVLPILLESSTGR